MRHKNRNERNRKGESLISNTDTMRHKNPIRVEMPRQLKINEATADKQQRREKDRAWRWWCKVGRAPQLRK